MFVSISHPHKCKCLAKAPSMGEGRSWWVGQLTEKLPEYPHETHCLHLRTKFKDVTFLCNMGDFQQLQVLCRVVTGKIDEDWIDSMVKISKTKIGNEKRKEVFKITDAQKDGAYAERNNLVAALARLFPSSLERHPEDESWEDDWRWIVFIDLPTGQATWHIHDSELEKFSTIPRFAGRTWDGHTTEQKYERLAKVAQ